MVAIPRHGGVPYSVTYLDGDARHGRFLGALAATVAAVEPWC
ncbi:MAG: hypothetical protein U0W40_00675 [Acidimicrobiia bacterium]